MENTLDTWLVAASVTGTDGSILPALLTGYTFRIGACTWRLHLALEGGAAIPVLVDVVFAGGTHAAEP
jgi:hypothetical protein